LEQFQAIVAKAGRERDVINARVHDLRPLGELLRDDLGSVQLRELRVLWSLTNSDDAVSCLFVGGQIMGKKIQKSEERKICLQKNRHFLSGPSGM
jgi:hypothetical protein